MCWHKPPHSAVNMTYYSKISCGDMEWCSVLQQYPTRVFMVALAWFAAYHPRLGLVDDLGTLADDGDMVLAIFAPLPTRWTALHALATPFQSMLPLAPSSSSLASPLVLETKVLAQTSGPRLLVRFTACSRVACLLPKRSGPCGGGVLLSEPLSLFTALGGDGRSRCSGKGESAGRGQGGPRTFFALVRRRTLICLTPGEHAGCLGRLVAEQFCSLG